MREQEFILNYTSRAQDQDPSAFDFWDNPIRETMDWRYILRQSQIHRVTPLLYHNIKSLPVPADILSEMEKNYTYTAFRNMLYMEETEKITGKLDCIILKGPQLARDVYGNIALRPFADVDILVRKEKIDEARDILFSMGYLSKDENFYRRYHFHLPFMKYDKIPFHLELHWEFVDRFIPHTVRMSEAWETRQGDRLAKETNILYLLLHIEKHAFFNKAIYRDGNPREWIFTNPLGNQLIWFSDLYRILRGAADGEDFKQWDNLKETAKRWGIYDMIGYNLYILQALYKAGIPEDLPRPELGRIKKTIYNLAAAKMRDSKMDSDMQFRPIRGIDLVNYLFPSGNSIKKYYCRNKQNPVILLRIAHFCRGVKEILFELKGICIQKLSTRKKKASPSAGWIKT